MPNMVQELIVQVDSKSLLEEYLKIAIPTVLNSVEEIAIKVINYRKKYVLSHVPTWHGDRNSMPVIRIGGSDFDKNKKNLYFDGYKPWETMNRNSPNSGSDSSVFVHIVTNHIIDIFNEHEKQWKQKFLKVKGDGYNSGFMKSDGMVYVGYQITSGHCFPEELTISLVHIYYGR